MSEEKNKNQTSSPEIDEQNPMSEEVETANAKEAEDLNELDNEQENSPEDCESKVREVEEKYLRLHADFDNFRRRNAKERLELIQNASKSLIIELLPVLDDFNRSLKSIESAEKATREGIELVQRKLVKVLENQGLSKMECHQMPFDPELHEAVTQIPAPTDELQGKIVDVLEDGYVLNDKVIRFAKVVIGQ